MYDRAMKQLKAVINNRGLDNKVLDRSNYDLIHFHIDAFDDKISLNRFEALSKQNRVNQSISIATSSFTEKIVSSQ